MPYSHSSPLGGCSSDQSTLGSHGVNGNWPEGFQSATFCGEAVSVSNQSPTNSTTTAIQYSHTSSYHQSGPIYGSGSPYSYPQSFAQSPQETVFGLPLAPPYSKTTTGLTVIQTDIPFKREPQFSPGNPSPSSAASQFYAVPSHLRSSTPSLVSSTSTPPTGRSMHIPLTPDLSFQQGNHSTSSPNHYDNTKTNSPMLYNGSTGATPALNALNLEDPSLQLTPMTDLSISLRRQSSSVLLDSNYSSQNSQRVHQHLDPLEIEDDLTAIDAHASNTAGLNEDYGNISINIVSDDSYSHTIPVTVALDNQPGNWFTPLSPLTQFVAIPITPTTLSNNAYGVEIGPTNWISHIPPSTPSPSINVASSSHDGRSESLTPSSSQNILTPEPPLRGANNSGYESADPQEALEAVRNGLSVTVVNPRGVSDRTLAAALANRKREAKFCCSVCGNSQTSKQNLDNHIMSRHLQLKRFVCPVPNCDAKYGHARGVNRHLDSKHPGYRLKGKRGPSKRSPAPT